MATTEDCYVDTTSAGSNFPETRSHDSGGPNDDDQSLDAFDDFFNSRSSVGQNGQRGLGGPEFTSTPNARRLEGETTQTYSNTTMSSSNSPTASPATSRRTGNRQRSMRKAHQRTSNRNTMFVSENNNQGSTNQLQGSTNQLQSSNSIENAGRHSSVDNHVESAASSSAATANGFANMQGKIQQLENDLRERGEQILQLRRDNRKVQARVDESGDALSMAQATHEKLLEDMQSRCKRQVDAAQRNVKMELEESQEMIQELSEQLQIIQDEASREKTNADKYKHETEKVNDRLQVTNSQLVEVSSQCQKLTEAAMMKDRDNRGHMDMQRLENVQSEEALQNYQKQIYELQLELEQAKNDTRLELLRQEQSTDNSSAHSTHLEKKLSETLILLEQTKNDLSNTRAENMALKNSSDNTDGALNQQSLIHKSELANLKMQVTELTSQKTELNSQITEKNSSIYDKSTEIADLNSIISQSNTKEAMLSTDLKHSKSGLEEKNMILVKQQAVEQNLREQQEKLFSTNAELQQQLTKITSENSKLEHTSELQTDQISKLTSNLENLQLENKGITDLKSQHQNQQITTLEAELNNKRSALDQANTELKSQNVTTTEQAMEITKLTAIEQSLRDNQEKINSQLNDLGVQLSEKTKEQMSATHNVQQLQHQLDTTTDKVSRLESENSKIPELTSQLNKTLAVYEQMEKLQSLLDEKLQEISSLTETKSELQGTIRKFENKTNSLLEENKTVNVDLAKLQEENKFLEGRHLSYDDKLSSKQSEITKFEESEAKFREQIEKMYSDNMEAHKNLAEKSSSINQAEDAANKLKTLNSEQTARIDELQSKNGNCLEEIGKLTERCKNFENLEVDLKNVQDRLEMKTHEEQSLAKQLDGLTDKMDQGDSALNQYLENIRSLEGDLKTKEMEANNLGDKLGIYEEKVASYESQLENHNILVKQAQEQSKSIDSLTRVNGDLSGQIRTKDDQLLQAKGDYKKLEDAVSKRSSDSGTLQLEINRLRSQVASQNEDNDDLKAQLLKQNIVRAKELAEQSSNSLAAEIETADRRDFGANSQEIIEKLTRDLTSCKSNNEQLRQYLDKILQSILEKDPSILEVK